MVQYTLILKQAILVGVLISGLMGSVLFFPLRIQAGYTCLFHQLYDSKNQIDDRTQRAGQNTNVKQTTAALASQKFLKHYMHGYELLWWLSLGLMAGGFYELRHLRKTNLWRRAKSIPLKMHSIS